VESTAIVLFSLIALGGGAKSGPIAGQKPSPRQNRGGSAGGSHITLGDKLAFPAVSMGVSLDL
jgi:hypothetical protein